jgi:DMSO/TMAO reductase YedYZ heme-binding membrane subunit
MVLKKILIFYILIFVFAFAVSLFALASDGYGSPFTLTIRLLALNGYIDVAVAAIMTPFLKEITLFFKKSFTKVHHYFAVIGLLLITLHPIVVSIQALSPAVILPNFGSLYLFFFTGGVIALILVYVAVGAAIVRRKIAAFWRPLHAIMYLALFIGVVHANLRGTDFPNIFFQIIYDGLFTATLVAFGLKRWQFYRIKIRKSKLTSQAIIKAQK